MIVVSTFSSTSDSALGAQRFSALVPKWVQARIVARRISLSLAPLLIEADNLARECSRKQNQSYTAFARNRLANYAREIARSGASMQQLCKPQQIRRRGTQEIDNRVKRLSGLLDMAREVLKLDGQVRTRAPELQRKYIETRTEGAGLLLGEAGQLFHRPVVRFQHSYDRLPRARDLAEVRSCLAELENVVREMQDILNRWRLFEAEVDNVRLAIDGLDRAAIVRDPEATEQFNKLQATWAAAKDATASGALGQGEARLRDARRCLSRTTEYVNKAIRNAQTELDLWRDILAYTEGISDELRSRVLAIPHAGIEQNLQQWEIIKEQLEKETDSSAARTRAAYADVLRTKACQLKWGEHDLEKYKSYVRQTRRLLTNRADTLPASDSAEVA